MPYSIIAALKSATCLPPSFILSLTRRLDFSTDSRLFRLFCVLLEPQALYSVTQLKEPKCGAVLSLISFALSSHTSPSFLTYESIQNGEIAERQIELSL